MSSSTTPSLRLGALLLSIGLVTGLSIGLPGCGTDDDSGRGEFQLPAGAKADDPIYSCSGACGAQAPGGCWCDTLCSTFGDCCPDKETACPDAVPPPPNACSGGTLVKGPTTYVDSTDGKTCEFSTQVCLTNDSSACPQPAPLSPDWCQDGEVGYEAPTFLESTDNMMCTFTTPVCLTRDTGACPQPAPPPLDWCKDGKKTQGAPTFVDSTDGKKCMFPTLICLTTDAKACPQP